MTNPTLKYPGVTFLFCDFETFNLADLKEAGLDNYIHDPSLGASCLAWAADHEDIQVWLPHVGPMPERLLALLHDPAVIIIAWNAVFDRAIFRHVCKIDLPIQRFRDPMIIARSLSLPGKLEDVARILQMAELKDPRGEALKMMFCNPVSKGGEMTLFGIAPPLFRDHNSHPKEFAEYVEYCRQDVKAMRNLWYRLTRIPFPEREWLGWFLDTKINERGLPGRRDLAEKGLRLALKFIDAQRKLLKEKTGLDNPNSDTQMKAWLTSRGYPWNSLRAPTVQAELKNPESKLTPEAREALTLRSSARKSSYTKLEKFLSLLGANDRLCYQFRYMGATRTGRWASGGGEDASMQVQNLPRGDEVVRQRLDLALQLLNDEDYDGIVREFTNTKNPKDSITVVEFVITLMRSLFQAKPGNKLVVADKNAIENRALGWAAGCPAILEVFKHKPADGGDPYIAFAVYLYNKNYAELWKEYKTGNKEPRQMSKPAVLGGGYGLGGGEMYFNEYGDDVRGGLWGYAKTVCGVDMPKELAHKAVDVLRKSWPEVVQFWTDLEEAFKQVLKRGGVIKVGQVTWDRAAKQWIEHPTQGKQCVITFRRVKLDGGGYMIRMELPSGRALHYLNATLEEETRTSQKTGRPYTVQTIYYDGIEHSATQGADGKNVKKHHKWGRVKTYGGKLCLSGDTPVVTARRGVLPLKKITSSDLVWDGVQWVSHDGLQCNGVREVKTWMGLTGTSDHQILGGNEWHELGKTNNLNGLCSLLTGLASGLRLWCSQNQENSESPAYVATADKSSMLTPERCEETKLNVAPPAGAKKAAQIEPNGWGTTSFLTANFAKCGSENSRTFYPDATIQDVKRIKTTEAEAFPVMSRGDRTDAFFSNTQLHSPGGITQLLSLIERTTMEITSREISGSSLVERIQIIKDRLFGLRFVERNFLTKCLGKDLLRCGVKTLSTIISSADAGLSGVSTDTRKQRVYDLQNCGPNNRFMVMTEAGPVIVHNCENAVQAISRDDLLNSMMLADEMGFDIVGLFHDELLCEVENTWDGLQLEDLLFCMREVPEWAPGLPLGADGFEAQVYRKG